jgi:hypothetical protein
MRRFFSGSLLLALVSVVPGVRAWDHPGHSMVNEMALAALPADFPAFVREPANVERISFLAGEPDRWSHSPDLPLKHVGWPDHFFDLEQIPRAGLDVAKLPSLRYEFVLQFAAGRAANAAKFKPIDPARNRDQTNQWPGFLPWTITEYYGILKAAFASLRVYEELGTPAEIANARADIVYTMGIMGHFVGDGAQPLHATDNYNGWTSENPKGYTAWTGIHSWIDSGLINKVGIKLADVKSKVTTAQPISLAAREDGRDPMFVAALDYMVAQNRLVEPLYQMEKEGKLGQDPAATVSPEARAFIEGQLVRGGQMLSNIWITAWRASRPDTFLRGVLLRRQGLPTTTPLPAAAPAPATKS